MAIARILQTGFEWASPELLSLFPFAAATVPNVFDGIRYTGAAALAFGGSTEGRWTDDFGSISQARMNIMHLSSGVAAGKSPTLLFLIDDVIGTPIAILRYDIDNTQLEAVCGATEVATYSTTMTDSTWRQIGVDIKIDGAAGWFYVYVDGVEVIGFDGDTNDGGADFNKVGVGGMISGDSWSTMYLDDFYIDNSTGEASPVVPPLRKFYIHKPNGDGNYSNWLGSDGNSASNYLLVDEDPPNTTDWLEHDTTTEEDTYTTAYNTEDVPADSIVNAVILQAYARKVNSTTALDLKVMTREDGVDDVGTAQSLTLNWEVYWERFVLDPSSTNWTKTTVDAMEIGIYVE